MCFCTSDLPTASLQRYSRGAHPCLSRRETESALARAHESLT